MNRTASRTVTLPVIALVLITLAVMGLAAMLTSPPAGARPFRPAGDPGGGIIGITVTASGLTVCLPSGARVPAGESSQIVWIWVPGPCPSPAASSPAPSPAASSPAPAATRPAVRVTPSPLPSPPPVPVTAAAPVPTARVTPPAPPRRPGPHPAAFRPAPHAQPAIAYTPGRPVMPIGVLITVVMTPCVITVAARLGRLLGGR